MVDRDSTVLDLLAVSLSSQLASRPQHPEGAVLEIRLFQNTSGPGLLKARRGNRLWKVLLLCPAAGPGHQRTLSSSVVVLLEDEPHSNRLNWSPRPLQVVTDSLWVMVSHKAFSFLPR